MTRVLVTGANSFTARHLWPLLGSSQEMELYGTDLQPQGPSGVEYHPVDITEKPEVQKLVQSVRPDLVFHLAGITSPDPEKCFLVNLEGTRHLLSGCDALDTTPRLIFISSAAVYGLTGKDESPVSESVPLRPVSHYGVSKAAAELAVLAAHRRGTICGTVVRPFNLVGPGLPRGLAPSDFASQVRDIRDKQQEPVMRVGDLSPRRDFLDVRDAVRAYVLLGSSEDCWGRVFNVGTGIPVLIENLLTELADLAGVEVVTEQDPAKMRPVEVEEQVANFDALKQTVGWEPKIPLRDSLREMLES